MKKQIVIFVPLIVLAIIFGVFLFSYRPQDNTVDPKIEEKQERTDRVTQTVTETGESRKDPEDTTPAETPEQVEREIIEQPQALHALEPVKEIEKNPPAPEEPAAWARLEYITQNPQQWGQFSPEATELMAQLTPTWRTGTKGETEEAIVLLEELSKLQDPRSAEIFVNYLNENGLWVRYVESALIAIGPPSVPLLVPLLDENGSFSNSFKRKRAVKLLGIIGSEYQEELGGAVEYIFLPKLEELTMLNPDYYGVRAVAGEAIFRLSSHEQDSTVASQIEGKQEGTDRVTAAATETSEQSQIPHAPEPVEKDEENPPAPEEPADLVAAAWAHLEYITQNPQQWGELSPEATELMAQLTPTWIMRSEGEGEQAIELLDQLTKLRDPRSPEIFVNYLRAGVSGRPMEAALIEIGPPSVPPLISLLGVNAGFLRRQIGAELLGIVGSEYQQELGGAVEYVILPKLEKLATSDPNPKVREVAGEAISRFSYLPQDNAAETPEAVDREISEIIEHPQVLHAPEPSEEDEESSPASEELSDPVAAAWARLEYISQNPQQWGELSLEATELIAQLIPTRTISTEAEMEEVIGLLEKLGELQDPRSPEIFVNYFLEGGLWGKPMKEALIAIGPPSVPLLIPLLDTDRFLGRLIAVKLLGIIGSEHHHELGGAVEYIILPKLKKLVTSDPNPRVRRYASVAIARISYGQQDNTVETPEQVEREINETTEQPQVPHAPEPAKEDEENPPASGEPADPVAAAWARLEYISQNPQEWGEFSPEAAELMAQLTPTMGYEYRRRRRGSYRTLGTISSPNPFKTLVLQQIFVNYLLSGVSGKPMTEALIAIGPPSVPLLIPLLDANADLRGRLRAPRLLGIIGSEYRQELGGAVEYIILPKLEKLATSDPIPRVRQYASEAVSKLR